MPDRPTTRRSLAHLGSQRLPAARVRRLLVPVRPRRGQGRTRAGSRRRSASCSASRSGLTTWVFPVTFMIAMAWGCETHARQLGRRTLLFYDGEAASVLRRDQACRSAPRPWPRQTRDPPRGRPVSVGRCSDRLHRLRRSRPPHHGRQLARCARCARRALARDRDRRHLKPKVGGALVRARDLLARDWRDTGPACSWTSCGIVRGWPFSRALGPRRIAGAGDPGQRRGARSRRRSSV